MPVKRSRIGRSSSFGDTRVALPPPLESADGGRMARRAAPPPAATSRKRPIRSSKAFEKSVEESPPRILTLSSPVQEGVGSGEKELIGDFLGRCYYCKKQINENAEVFMYSYLLAFCTVECRDIQIAIDNDMEKASGTFKGLQLSSTE